VYVLLIFGTKIKLVFIRILPKIEFQNFDVFLSTESFNILGKSGYPS